MSPRQTDDMQAALAALADETLPVARRAELLDRVRESPAHGEDLDRQRQALASMRALEDVRAPASLRQSIEALAGDGRSRVARRRMPRLRPAAAGGLAASLAALAAIVAVVLGSGSSPAPTVLEAARVALRPATLAAPVENPHNRALLESSVEGVPYPYWGGRRGWRTAGSRVDRLGGRTITTVFYAARDGGRIGYAIVAGDPLSMPAGGGVVTREGTSFHVLDTAGATVVSWREAGHTCILAAHDVAAKTLLRLVS
jgi:hypothetical protein